MVFDGHCRFGRLSGWYGLYFFEGSSSLEIGQFSNKELVMRAILISDLHGHDDSQRLSLGNDYELLFARWKLSVKDLCLDDCE